ncbi:twin-arginine translocase TatA/TatE family subunit [Candidatus Nitrosotenuis chungbukensis]|uniref:twin-arginine translocase TatA/TatE family subunit n=1 Tax=Candidatus Nitrosotenuis chungbukensis TaxID=1353246 RepID=UPI0005B26B86|nr:twin-arginine translocase TatA/TatE family subunit [Candidatus Nitrosotenuis chungbukensis]WKT57957.1 twin-arginine translocase TatA/TatE family subunit [Candidatus Nitrosotenuis chungbukensis]
MQDYALNILGSEWVIIVLVALIVLFGTNKIPDVAKKLGRTVGEYNRAKEEIQNQISGITNANLNITNPVQNERQKLEAMAKSLGIDFAAKTDDEIKKAVSEKMPKNDPGQKDKKQS